MKSLKRMLRGATVAAAAFLTACASLPPELAGSDAVDVESVDSRSARVALVQARAVDDQHLKVSGYLEKRFQPRGPIPGQLRIQAIGSNGSVLDDVVSDYHRRNVKSSHSYFSQTLSVPIDQLHTVRVTHYGLGQSIR